MTFPTAKKPCDRQAKPCNESYCAYSSPCVEHDLLITRPRVALQPSCESVNTYQIALDQATTSHHYCHCQNIQHVVPKQLLATQDQNTHHNCCVIRNRSSRKKKVKSRDHTSTCLLHKKPLSTAKQIRKNVNVKPVLKTLRRYQTQPCKPKNKTRWQAHQPLRQGKRKQENH